MRPSLATIALALLAVTTILGTTLAENKREPVERLSATSYNWLGDGKAGVTEIKIYEWSKPEEREALIKAFRERGSDGLVEVLGNASEKGSVRSPDSVTYKMTYAYQFDQGDTRKIVMATDRPMSPRASVDRAEYNISLVFIELDKEKNKGTGQMILAAKIGIDEATGRLEITSATQDPVRFTSVRGRKPKKKK